LTFIRVRCRCHSNDFFQHPLTAPLPLMPFFARSAPFSASLTLRSCSAHAPLTCSGGQRNPLWFTHQRLITLCCYAGRRTLQGHNFLPSDTVRSYEAVVARLGSGAWLWVRSIQCQQIWFGLVLVNQNTTKGK